MEKIPNIIDKLIAHNKRRKEEEEKSDIRGSSVFFIADYYHNRGFDCGFRSTIS